MTLESRQYRLLIAATLFIICFLFIFHTPIAEAELLSVQIKNIPHVKQKPDFCGEACVEMYLKNLGYQTDQDDVFDHSGLDPLQARGCYTRDLLKAVQAIGFKTGNVYHKIDPKNSTRDFNVQFAEVHKDLLAGYPTIMCMHYNDQPNTTEHFRLITGYDAKTDQIIYQEPAIKKGANLRMSRKMLYRLLPLKYRKEYWTLIRIPLRSQNLKQTKHATHFTDADYAQHIMKLKKKLPGKGFTILIRKPFVVLGDEDAKTVEKRADNTVNWAVTKLKKRYFKKDPTHIIDVWLFKDKKSYLDNTKAVFNDTPGTPFGYYSPRHQALVMNISTGGGTLVHEIVHPFIASNFPKCPSWFNEGLASLYEQCGEEKGVIHGYTNWRLNGLKQAIKAKSVPHFKTLCATTRDQFYDEDPGSNYSQARYLCYYLQQNGLLQKYYETFRDNVKTDPTGYQSLQKVLNRKDIPTFKKEWEKWVMTLR